MDSQVTPCPSMCGWPISSAGRRRIWFSPTNCVWHMKQWIASFAQWRKFSSRCCRRNIKRADNGILKSLDRPHQVPLGIEADKQYADFSFTLGPGDSMFIYTDGVTESRTPAGEFYGLARLDEVLLNHPCCSAVEL